jgi:hypothetical protein
VSPSLHVDSAVSGPSLGSAVYVTEDLRCVGFDRAITEILSRAWPREGCIAFADPDAPLALDSEL